MDNAVALVQSYLRVNGYFTVTEYPIIEASRDTDYRTATDTDILALRFPSTARMIPSKGHRASTLDDQLLPDPALDCPLDKVDMIVGEVKEGRAELNKSARKREVLAAVLTRFGCCHPDMVTDVVDTLAKKSHALTPDGHVVRLVAFGKAPDTVAGSRHYKIVPMDHVVQFLQDYLDRNWGILHHAQFKDPVLGFLATLKKAALDHHPER